MAVGLSRGAVCDAGYRNFNACIFQKKKVDIVKGGTTNLDYLSGTTLVVPLSFSRRNPDFLLL